MGKKESHRNPGNHAKEQDIQSGLLLMVDIERFSGRPAAEQKALVKRLGAVLSGSELVKKSQFGAVCNSTGDGCLVAFTRPVDESALIELASEVIMQMHNDAADCPSAGLRVGLHRGSFVSMHDPTNGNMVAIGTGPNLCSRVLAFADAGYIVASESFCSHWESELGDKALGVTTEFSRPFLVYAKHDFPLRIRIYTGKSARHKSKLPSKIMSVLAVELEIIRALGEIEARYLAEIHASPPKEHGDDLISARVSLFAYHATDEKKDEGVLEPTLYRYHRKNVRPSQGTTHYPVKDPPGSPQAKCFVTRKAKAVSNLPDPDEDLVKYEASLRDEGFSSENLGSFSRRARSFLCFHFGRPDSFPLGIVCIDTHDPVNYVSRADLEKVGEGLHDAYSSLLASLWTERVK